LAKSPVSGESLFEASNHLSDAVLNWYGESIDQLDLYAESYRLAARFLVAESPDDQLRDVGACPVVFLYRLSLELYLKSILILGARILQEPGEPLGVERVLNRNHNLSDLWNDLKKLYGQLEWKWDPELDAAGRLIRDFQDRDPKASYFRYPVKKDGGPAFECNFSFQLHNFCDRVEELLEFLDGINCGLAGILDERQEALLNRY
jgi:hypothetical protein